MNIEQLVLITGMSGSGKSVALAALEDAGFYCVDNLPPELLQALIDLQTQHGHSKLAIAMDVRSASSLPQLPLQLATLMERGLNLSILFLDATDEVLFRRFSETRRNHPLSPHTPLATPQGLKEAIELERELLALMREQAHVIDTSLMRPAMLLNHIKAWVADAHHQPTLIFESFAYKRGIPMDADFVFDVRMLPNPHYENALRPLTGMDADVATYLKSHAATLTMIDHISGFLNHWLPHMIGDHRNYVTVAIGCTGGQHRSVFVVEALTQHFQTPWCARSRHREYASWPCNAVANPHH
jgi:UPF0042 nucleotide-binding protein